MEKLFVHTPDSGAGQYEFWLNSSFILDQILSKIQVFHNSFYLFVTNNIIVVDKMLLVVDTLSYKDSSLLFKNYLSH